MDYAKEYMFKSRLCIPEHPESNGIAERFMGVPVWTVHAAKEEGKDLYLATGKAPADFMFRRS